ncbi:MAG: oxidoreductase family protein [Chitinophagales bacterium]
MQHFITFQNLTKNGYQIAETIQSLWSGYGQIVRLKNANGETLIAKHINPPSATNHPRGWNTNASHQRKLQSYLVELHWYTNYAQFCDNSCRIPQLISSESIDQEHLIILEDLNSSGFPKRKSSLQISEIKVVLNWLANFHATFLDHDGSGLWPIGTYWHLATRREEWEAMEAGQLKKAATKIDHALNNCQFKTLVHGDAKLANFCFANDGNKVAAVDFQYIGKGCGMKDVVYFLGSCLTDNECEKLAPELLDFYFQKLEDSLTNCNFLIDFTTLEKEWRQMYPIAWADFHRFLLGWMPTHQKLTSYSKQQVKLALAIL